ncbi:MAG TPA: VOC family protein [Isosphaeraceae bacterium]|jgi:PhnB protein|nr:VOC family protein [Isosphaeraceae bacterium]
MMAVEAIPSTYAGVTPYLIVDGAARAIDFYKEAFGAVECERLSGPNGKVGHAEVRIHGAAVMLADEHPEMGILGPKSVGGTPVTLMFYVEDVDATFARALDAGATVRRPIENRFYGDRSGMLVDPFGHVWALATHVEDVPPDEMRRRAEEFGKKQGCE